MSELFNGTWTIDVPRSTVWDDQTRSYIADQVGAEIITLRIQDGVQDYEVLYGDNPTIRMGYTSRYDDPTWVKYEVREVIGVTQDELEASIGDFKRRIHAADGERERTFTVGAAYGIVRTVYVDERTHYRISKSDDGHAQSIMMRRLAEDGQSYLASVLTTDGIVYRTRWFVRV